MRVIGVFFFFLSIVSVDSLYADSESSFSPTPSQRRALRTFIGKGPRAKKSMNLINRLVARVVEADFADKNSTISREVASTPQSERLYLKQSPQYTLRNGELVRTGTESEFMRRDIHKRLKSNGQARVEISELIGKDLSKIFKGQKNRRKKGPRLAKMIKRMAIQELAKNGEAQEELSLRRRPIYPSCKQLDVELPMGNFAGRSKIFGSKGVVGVGGNTPVSKVPEVKNPESIIGGSEKGSSESSEESYQVSFYSQFGDQEWLPIDTTSSIYVEGSGILTFKAVFTGSEGTIHEVSSDHITDAIVVAKGMNLLSELIYAQITEDKALLVEESFGNRLDASGNYKGSTVILFKAPDGELVELVLGQENTLGGGDGAQLRGQPIGFDCVPYLIWNHRKSHLGIDSTGENLNDPYFSMTHGTLSMVSIADDDGEDAYVTAIPITFTEETTILQIKSLSNKIDNDFSYLQLGDVFLDVFSSVEAFEQNVTHGDVLHHIDLNPIEIRDFGLVDADGYGNKLLTYESEAFTLPAGEYYFVVWADNNHSFNHVQSLIEKTGGIDGDDRIGSDNWTQSYLYQITPGFEGTAAIDVYVTNDYTGDE